jgi:hypothetical protein
MYEATNRDLRRAISGLWSDLAALPELWNAPTALSEYMERFCRPAGAALYNSEYAAACKKISSTWETLC